MSFNEVLAELPSLSFEERQTLIRRALELDDSAFTPADDAEIERRRLAHHHDPAAAIPADEMKDRLRSRFEA